ncbi:bifunctional (p)ppGpp synthetase/guanosine-3',5'-bis(diphosphate) 3'-pyrophosphohydrolase [Oceanobacillus piezotolerans]|uniref:Bifunctional (P)ppGpp synthetase/guanosine-3',5'-bis(Diphosphate) 3'-pyrophosphohydrolase n=1 Tax=Oceanobacillus piezotolerans TaxID=2448030 RepID=A0A498DEW6_9BACI|nr:HD domain-containing protein [Oceanobacillus piezotolerans]RLL42069.1 bifunctional (p)ppGpp synthetase/guanosine-3',5'-bis(diphosphate) 3'-pyrophosphohydrolase [Oceanobacillus piezotolerans]
MKEKAKAFAIKAHFGQTRKNSNAPYITHPIRVAERLQQAGFRDELVSAGYLHDVAEDTPYTLEDIKKEFGPEVARIVAAHTEDKSKSWQERKQHTINTIKEADKEIKYLIIADKLDNLLGLEKDLAEQGDRVWEKFNAGPEKQKWYNQSIAENMYSGIQTSDIPDYFSEYEEAVLRVFSHSSDL